MLVQRPLHLLQGWEIQVGLPYRLWMWTFCYFRSLCMSFAPFPALLTQDKIWFSFSSLKGSVLSQFHWPQFRATEGKLRGFWTLPGSGNDRGLIVGPQDCGWCRLYLRLDWPKTCVWFDQDLPDHSLPLITHPHVSKSFPLPAFWSYPSLFKLSGLALQIQLEAYIFRLWPRILISPWILVGFLVWCHWGNHRALLIYVLIWN